MDSEQAAMIARAAWIKNNPHNLPGIAGAPQKPCFDYWRARYEQEGRAAPLGATCPYSLQVMAGQAWQRGQDWQEGARRFGQGFSCPDSMAAGAGWHEARGYYLAWGAVA